MFRLISLAAISLFISACASSGPEAPEVADSAQSGEVVEATAAAVAAAEANNPDEIICRKERQTGSRFATKVCRTRAEIEARAAKDQKALGDSRATQSGRQCVLEGTC